MIQVVDLCMVRVLVGNVHYSYVPLAIYALLV